MIFIIELEADKPKYFWDGFQWVAKTNSIPNIDPNILNQTRKMRKVQISNLPLYMGLTENDIKQIVSQFLIDNFLNDVGNFNPIVSVCLNHQGNFAILEVSSVEETNRLIKIESKLEFLQSFLLYFIFIIFLFESVFCLNHKKHHILPHNLSFNISNFVI